ncbi:MAG TPA: hypothetical protein V6C97_18495 [Oculatellaceae cyanobacterium]
MINRNVTKARLNLACLVLLADGACFSLPPASHADVASSAISFSYPDERLNLSYPGNWTVQKDGDKNTILKVASPEGSAMHGTFVLSLLSGIDDEKLALSLLEQMVRTQMPSYKVIASGSDYLGSRRQIRGSSQSLLMKFGQTDVVQKQVVVRTPRKSILVLQMISPQNESAAVDPIFNGILASVRFEGATGKPGSVASSRSDATRNDAVEGVISIHLSRFSNKSPAMSIDYPTGWTQSNVSEDGAICKFVQTFDGKQAGELGVNYMNAPRLSLDDLSEMIDAHILQRLKNYHRVREESVTFGAPRSFSGRMIEGTFSFLEGRIVIKPTRATGPS